MSKLTIAGIRRENQFSPNHIGDDAASFSLTVQHLRDLGWEVNEYIESDLIWSETGLLSINYSRWKIRVIPLSTPAME